MLLVLLCTILCYWYQHLGIIHFLGKFGARLSKCGEEINDLAKHRRPRVDRYTGYIRYLFRYRYWRYDNLKIPIYRHFGILLPNTELKRYFKSNLLTITFRKQS